MANKSAHVLVLLVVCCALVVSVSSYKEGRRRRVWEREDKGGRRKWDMGEEEGGGGDEGEEGDKRREGGSFLLQHSMQVVRTDAGNMRVVKGFGGKFIKNPMHVGFITMAPQSLFVPQYIDSNLIIFVTRGEARLGYMYEDQLTEKQLKKGDVYRVPAGSSFYLHNSAEEHKLHVVCSIDTTDSMGWHTFQSFFIGGGTNPISVLSGFDHETISTAFNVTIGELREVMTNQRGGPIVSVSNSHAGGAAGAYMDEGVVDCTPERPAPSVWLKFLASKEHRLSQLKNVVPLEEKSRDEDEQTKWSWRKLLQPLFGEENVKKNKMETTSTGPDAYNLYDRTPDFKNGYGWSVALDEDDYSPLTDSGVGVYFVNLTAGSMMAPHVNPTATEYGIVLKGSGTIQIVHPNGTLAMKAKVHEGDVFWVPRYFAFCQVASSEGSFEFFGFTTSDRKNKPQFLVGAGSLLQRMMGPELAAAFEVSEEKLEKVTNAQRESTILPSASVSPPEVMSREKEERGEEDRRGISEVMMSLANELVMGFN